MTNRRSSDSMGNIAAVHVQDHMDEVSKTAHDVKARLELLQQGNQAALEHKASPLPSPCSCLEHELLMYHNMASLLLHRSTAIQLSTLNRRKLSVHQP